MTADEWKARLKALHDAAVNGDNEPLDLFCSSLAEMDEVMMPTRLEAIPSQMLHIPAEFSEVTDGR